ncbi:MAG: RDD family protein [Phycisphaerae bacterium]|nr:RDD family protein [Phycisphaerae bacterium]
MNPSTRNRRTVILVATALLAAWASCLSIASGSDKSAPPKKPERILIAGGTDVLWAVRTGQGDDGDKFDLLIRRPGGKWRTLPRFSGEPTAIAAGVRRLHVISGSSAPSTTVFWLSEGKETNLRSMAPGGKWPLSGAPSVIVPVGPMGKSSVPGFLAAVPHESDRLSTTATATQPAVKNSGLTVLQTVDGKWESLCKIDDIPGAVGAQVSIASAGDWVYLLVIAKDFPARLMAWNITDKTMVWKDVAFPGSLKDPLSLSAIKNRAVLITKAPATGLNPEPGADTPDKAVGIRLFIRELKADTIANDTQSIRDQDKPLVLPIGSEPASCWLGKADEKQLVLLWRQKESYRCALVDINGQLAENKEVKELSETETFDARVILGYFLWGIPPLIILLMIFGQKNRSAVLPILPQRFIPAAFLKRLAAFLIDWIPITFLASIALVILKPDLNPTVDELMEMFGPEGQRNIPIELIMCRVGSFVVWIAYGSIMEHRFGATLGKMAMKLEVVSIDGQRPAIQQVIIRNLIRPIEISLLPVLIITVSLSFLTRTRQRLGDLPAKTVVVEKRRAEIPMPTDETPQNPMA